MAVRRTVVPYGRLAMRGAKLATARGQKQGVQVLSFEQLVTRLAGGFARPIDPDTLKQVLDGRFTNDKFCFVRHGQLALSWRRAPFGPDRRPAAAEASAPEGSRPRGVDHEPASLDGHALLDQPSGRAQALGQSLSAASRRGWTVNNRGPRRRRSEASPRGEPPCR